MSLSPSPCRVYSSDIISLRSNTGARYLRIVPRLISRRRWLPVFFIFSSFQFFSFLFSFTPRSKEYLPYYSFCYSRCRFSRVIKFPLRTNLFLLAYEREERERERERESGRIGCVKVVNFGLHYAARSGTAVNHGQLYRGESVK